MKLNKVGEFILKCTKRLQTIPRFIKEQSIIEYFIGTSSFRQFLSFPLCVMTFLITVKERWLFHLYDVWGYAAFLRPFLP